CITRSRNSNSLHSFDPEIDKTLNRIKKAKIIHVGSNNSVSESGNFENKSDIADKPLYEPESMENNNRTLKELVTPDLEPAQSYELKSRLIHLLPKFHSLVGEDPHKQLKEFHVVCSTMRLQGISEDDIKMKTFPFSLDGATKDWLFCS
ncbi:hypothetical protein CR513_03745, partial [Mucuna pruriens]